MSYKFIRYYIYDYRNNVVRIRISSDVCQLYVVCLSSNIVFRCLCIHARARVTLGLSMSRLCPSLSCHM